MRWLLVALIAVACADAEELTPPPVAKGKCSTSRYTGERASLQWCAFDGSWWSCEYSQVSERVTCNRGEPLPNEKP